MYRNSDARQRVLRRLLEHGPSTVEELAQQMGVVPVTMRSHLSALQDQGLVSAEDERGHVGRPRRRYALTRDALAQLPNHSDSLAASLLDGLQSLAGRRGVDQLLDVAASRCAREQLAAVGDCRDFGDRVAAVARLLEAESGLARWDEAGGTFRIREFHCPYGELALGRPDVCRFHTQVVTRLLGAPARLESAIAQGQPQCVFAAAEPLHRAADVRRVSDGRAAP